MAKETKDKPATNRQTTAFYNSLSKRTQSLVGLIVVLLLIAGLIFFAVKYNQARTENKKLSDPKAAAQAQTAELVSQVGKLVQLPSNETPTVATVTDITKLKGQAFFANAQNGDKVLIYTQAKEAVLYRPSTNKIIQIAPVNLGNSSQTGGTSK